MERSAIRDPGFRFTSSRLRDRSGFLEADPIKKSGQEVQECGFLREGRAARLRSGSPAVTPILCSNASLPIAPLLGDSNLNCSERKVSLISVLPGGLLSIEPSTPFSYRPGQSLPDSRYRNWEAWGLNQQAVEIGFS